MEFVLAGLVGTIFSRTFEEYLARLCEVLCRQRNAGLKVKRSKCFLFKEEIAHLGHEVSAHDISTDSKETEAIQDYPAPQNIQEVWRFVGFCFIL